MTTAPAKKADSARSQDNSDHGKMERKKPKFGTRGTQKRAIETFKIHRSNKVQYCAFVGALKGGHAYEIWYLDDNEWCTSFVLLYETDENEFYESVQELVQDINLTRQLEKEALSLAVDRRIKLWVGAIAFLATLAVVLGLAIKFHDKFTIISATISVLASGCVAIFGVWLPKPWTSKHYQGHFPPLKTD